MTTTMNDVLRSRLIEFRERHGVPAIGAAVVTQDGAQELDVIGVRRRGGEDPVLSGDRWHVGSCGKSMTAAPYARLVERGEAAWGTPLPGLLPDLARERTAIVVCNEGRARLLRQTPARGPAAHLSPGRAAPR